MTGATDRTIIGHGEDQMITADELLNALRAQCDMERSGAEGCWDVIGPLDVAELADTINYLITH